MEKMTQKEFEINCKIDELFETIGEHKQFIIRHNKSPIMWNKVDRRIDMIKECMRQIDLLEEQLKN